MRISRRILAGLATASLAVTATSCGGPGITRSDLLIINKIDLAELVGANLNIMKTDTNLMRNGKPWFFTNLCSGKGVEEVKQFLESQIPNIINLKKIN